jgi:hypothetical protein
MNIRILVEYYQKYLWAKRRFNSLHIIRIGVNVPNKPDLEVYFYEKTQPCFISLPSNNLFDTFISFHELKLGAAAAAAGGWR